MEYALLIEKLTAIAADNHLLDDAGTLRTRKSDSLDFHDCAVWCIKQALEQAYELGCSDTRDEFLENEEGF